jgi:hypothetical protein
MMPYSVAAVGFYYFLKMDAGKSSETLHGVATQNIRLESSPP